MKEFNIDRKKILRMIITAVLGLLFYLLLTVDIDEILKFFKN